jgi:hypothetical protein
MATKMVTVQGYRSNTGSPQSWWNETGIFVNEGDSIIFDTTNNSGTNNPGFGDSFGPDGDNYSPDKEANKSWPESIAYRAGGTECWFGSLVGKIGIGGTAFCIGASNTITAPASGCLYLGFNDGVNFEDNDPEGSWEVDVTYEDCVQISSAYGEYRIILESPESINTDLFETWGVILTVQCGAEDEEAVWSSNAIANVEAAFDMVRIRLEARTTLSFKDVFGGLELRMVDSLGDIGGRTLNENVIRFGDVGRSGGSRTNSTQRWGISNAPGYPSDYGLTEAGDIGIRNTIIHELGHVFYKRASSLATTAGGFNLPAVYGTPPQGTYWENNFDLLLEEFSADHFLNWVRNSYVSADPDQYDALESDNNRRISAFWVGGVEFIEANESRGTSPGIQGFAEDANTAALASLDILEGFLGCIEAV